VEIPRSPAGRIGLLSRSPSKVEPMALEDFEDMDADLDKRPTRTSHGKRQQAINTLLQIQTRVDFTMTSPLLNKQP
jgi:hypothetical protein